MYKAKHLVFIRLAIKEVI